MATQPKRTEDWDGELTYEEGWVMFDEQARRRLGMSGEEFLAKYQAGEFGDPDADRRVMDMVFLLPFIRKAPLNS